MSEKVLLVDDELEFTTYVRKRLARRGIEVDAVHDGASAIERVRRVEYDVLILDMLMPGLDGMETLRAVQAIRPELPVIILTGHRKVETAVAGIKEGAFDYLVKPCDIEVLIMAIRDACTSHPKSGARG